MTDSVQSAPEAFAVLADSLGMVAETVAGYYRQCLAGGFDLDVAERMAEECHTEMIAYFFALLTDGIGQ